MKKLLYIIPAEFMDDSDGVTKKAKQQVRAFSNNGYAVDVASYNKEEIVIYEYREKQLTPVYQKTSSRVTRRRDLFLCTQKYLADKKYDVCYMRYPYASYQFVKMLRQIKQNGTYSIIEVPTYPIPRTLPKGVRGIPNRLIYTEEKMCIERMKKYVDKVYSMGEPVDEIFGIPNVNIPNGIDVNQFRARTPNVKGDTVRVLYCGSLFNYQGIDRLICGIEQYALTKTENEPQVIAEIVGDGPEMFSWSALAKEKGLEDRVIFHGFLSGEKLDAVVDRCDVACSLLAVHRGYPTNASPLKTKEYMARGIPFIYSYNENGMDADVKFALKIDSEETPLDIRAILKFYNSYADTQEAIIHEMRCYVNAHYSWENILKSI